VPPEQEEHRPRPPEKEGTQYLCNKIILLEIACCKQNTFIKLALCSPSYLSKHDATIEN